MNPKLQIFPVNYVNDPRIIGQNDNVVSVNSALSVDLIGQVAADSISADKIFSGAGGFVDFVRGASFSKGGKSIIAMPSTAMGGKASRIVEQFDAGRPITLSRFETHYVVTEYGIAQLRGQTLRQRGSGPHRDCPPRLPGRAEGSLRAEVPGSLLMDRYHTIQVTSDPSILQRKPAGHRCTSVSLLVCFVLERVHRPYSFSTHWASSLSKLA